ncbi:hypothetical protein Q9X98_004904 [Vibrio parahaemolyticus]|uniref:hypothetical protein n=1 Tax=Vibrio parahaemolyticus TaxID=670 RepID=UPI001F33E5F1|nr:hypothetical protein [Vibrio parahaemolyticus]ELA7323260.1 hypothetical protein [Vibrio parahaemolyticus]UJX32987.1 hypothetical protein JHS79_26560 [Vibrio parahaemolyticus]
MSQADYQNRVFTLLKPIENQKTVTVKPLSRESSLDIEPKGETFTQEEKEALVMASTGLSQDELDSLSSPDWLALYEASYDFYRQTGYQLANVERDDTAKDVILYFCDERKVSFELPTLKLSKMANKISDDIKRACFIVANLTDLEEDEIMSLPLPDYRSLVNAATNFLTKPAAYFQ